MRGHTRRGNCGVTMSGWQVAVLWALVLGFAGLLALLLGYR